MSVEGALNIPVEEGHAEVGGEPLKLLFVSLTGCPPCQPVKEALARIKPALEDQLEVESVVLETDEFVRRCEAGQLPVRGVPALVMYQGQQVIGRVVGLKGKHGTLDEAFLIRWLRRYGINLPGSHA